MEPVTDKKRKKLREKIVVVARLSARERRLL
jgi:hypothetical protein